MELFFVGLGFSAQDLLLIKLCPIFAVIGGIVHIVLIRDDFSVFPDKPVGLASTGTAFNRLTWMFARLALSYIVGLVFALYLVGALTESPTTIARILAFSVLVGFAAPKLWKSQEKVLTELIEKHLERTLEEYGVKAKEN